MVRFWLIVFLLAIPCAGLAEQPQHRGTKLEGYAVAVTPDSLTVFDKKGEQFKCQTGHDYSSQIGLGAEITLWYTKEGETCHVEDVKLPRESFFVPVNTVCDGIRRIIIIPKAQDVENTEGLTTAIGKYLQENAGWFVAPPELGAEIAQRVENSPASMASIDGPSGDVGLLDSEGTLARGIAQETRVDAVLEINVEKVKAPVRNSVASWDDMTEAIAANRTRALAKLTVTGGKGWVYAATVNMNLWDRQGKLLWKKRRGFAALGFQIGMGSKYRARPLTEVYADEAARVIRLG
jgi:hypothetical protein